MRLVSCSIVCVALMFVGSGSGCKKRTPPIEAQQQQQAQAAAEKKAEAPKKEEPKKEEAKKDEKAELKPVEYKGLVYNIHMAAHRPEIQNDLRSIGQFYQADVASGAEPTTVAAMKESLKTAGTILKKIDEKVYVINLHGKKLKPNEILAYEREASSPAGFCVVRASGEVDPTVPFEQMWKELYGDKK